MTGQQQRHLACIRLERIDVAGLDDTSLLGESDRTLLAGMSHPNRRRQFVAGRALAQALICSLGHQATRPTPIETSAAGKPYLPLWPELHLSISHSGEWVACAIASVPIGLDIERIDARRSTGQLIEQVCSKEEQRSFQSLSCDRRDRLFAELWTLKEAWLKRQGVSLDISLMRAIRWKLVTAADGNCASWITSACLAVTVLGPPAASFLDVPVALRSVPCTIRQIESGEMPT